MSYTNNSWKSIGGINRTSHQNIVNIPDMNTKNLNINKMGNSNFQKINVQADLISDISSGLRSKIQSNNSENVVLFYEMNSLDISSNIENKTLWQTPDIQENKHKFNLQPTTYANNVYAASTNFDPIYGANLQFAGNNVTYSSIEKINYESVFGNSKFTVPPLSNFSFEQTMTLTSWIKVDNSMNSYFNLFGMDSYDANNQQTNLLRINSDFSKNTIIENSDISSCMYVWYPNLNKKIQLTYVAKKGNFSQLISREIGDISSIPRNQWSLFVLTLTGYSINIYINGNLFFTEILDEKLVTSIPTENFIINAGPYWVDPTNNNTLYQFIDTNPDGFNLVSQNQLAYNNGSVQLMHLHVYNSIFPSSMIDELYNIGPKKFQSYNYILDNHGLFIRNETLLGNNLSVGGITNFIGTTRHYSSTIFYGPTNFQGNTSHDGNKQINGNMQVDGNMQVNGNMEVDGDVKIEGTLTIDGKIVRNGRELS